MNDQRQTPTDEELFQSPPGITSLHDYMLGQIRALSRDHKEAQAVMREMALTIAMHRLGVTRFDFTLDDYIEAQRAAGGSEGFAMGRVAEDAWFFEHATAESVAAENDLRQRAMMEALFGEQQKRPDA
jgi:hypothetical protein